MANVATQIYALAPFAEQIAQEDIETALVWVDTLRDDRLRSTVKDRISAMGR